METLYRFELAFCGEAQGVGFLQGLRDTPLPLVTIDELYEFFDKELPGPENLWTEDGSAVVFWFTHVGLAKFEDAINAIITELSSYDWQVIGTQISAPPFPALYKDDFQAAYSRSDLLEYLFPAGCNFTELYYVDAARSSPLIPLPFPVKGSGI